MRIPFATERTDSSVTADLARRGTAEIINVVSDIPGTKVVVFDENGILSSKPDDWKAGNPRSFGGGPADAKC